MLAWETCCRSDCSHPLLSVLLTPEKLTALVLGSSILFAYPELGIIAGVQGVLIYALSSALPLFAFAVLGPMIRRRCPEGFVLTEWTRQRYGVITGLFLSFMTLVTLFLYMIAELSAVGQVVEALTGFDPLPIMIAQAAVTTIYTCEFRIPVTLCTGWS